MTDYNVQLEPWYSPIKIINDYGKLFRYFGDNTYHNLFDRAHEMFAGAISLLGAYELDHGNIYYMQSNNQTETPDVVAAKQVEGIKPQVVLSIVNVEVVSLDDHSPETDATAFLKRTKLSPMKSYTEDDMIMLSINKDVAFNSQQFYQDVKRLRPRPSIFVIGRSGDDFMIFSPHPVHTKMVRFNAADTALKYQINDRVRFGLGSGSKITFKDLPPEREDVFDVLGLTKERGRIMQLFGKTGSGKSAT
jgi:hypothetical protein